VYGDEAGTERIFPFSLVPRILAPDEWLRIERGLIQRVTALNLFLVDVYGEQTSLRDGIVPADMILKHAAYQPRMAGFRPPLGVFVCSSGAPVSPAGSRWHGRTGR